MNSTWLLVAFGVVVFLLNLFGRRANGVDRDDDPPLYWLITIFSGGLVAMLIVIALAGY